MSATIDNPKHLAAFAIGAGVVGRQLAAANRPSRRLAPNVVRLFTDERPPVANPPRRRGRLPRNVVRFTSRPRLAIGDVCELCRGALPENHGKQVQVMGISADGFADIAAVSTPMETYDLATGERTGQAWRTCIRLDNLRRIRKGDCHVAR